LRRGQTRQKVALSDTLVHVAATKRDLIRPDLVAVWNGKPDLTKRDSLAGHFLIFKVALGT
jgi:hypothetical protein